MTDIFMSHVKEDAHLVQQLVAGLEDSGYTTWYHERDGVPGPSYLIQTGEAIEQSRAFLLVISKESLGSHQVTSELVRAHECRKPIVPLLVDVTHIEFQDRQPEWREAVGASTSLGLSGRDPADVVLLLTRGLRSLGIYPGATPMSVRSSSSSAPVRVIPDLFRTDNPLEVEYEISRVPGKEGLPRSLTRPSTWRRMFEKMGPYLFTPTEFYEAEWQLRYDLMMEFGVESKYVLYFRLSERTRNALKLRLVGLGLLEASRNKYGRETWQLTNKGREVLIALDQR